MEKHDAKVNGAAITVYARDRAKLIAKCKELGIEYDGDLKEMAENDFSNQKNRKERMKNA